MENLRYWHQVAWSIWNWIHQHTSRPVEPRIWTMAVSHAWCPVVDHSRCNNRRIVCHCADRSRSDIVQRQTVAPDIEYSAAKKDCKTCRSNPSC
ncbi:MAG: hypothetical protein HQL62_08750 [Magnetococcales bacterium]|nr:hypothetical protein [Magnetococcales bacterium]